MGTGHCLEVLTNLSTVANRDLMLASRRRGGRIERAEALRHLLREGFERGLGREHDLDLKRIVVERDGARGRHHVTDAGGRVSEQMLRDSVHTQRCRFRRVSAQLYDQHTIAKLGNPQPLEFRFDHELHHTLE
jgi:hypothetical protein